MAGILALGSVVDGGVQRATLEVAAAGRALATALDAPIYGALIGHSCDAAVQDFACAGMAELFVADHPRHAPYLAEHYIAAAEAIIGRCLPRVILVAHSIDSAEWVPQFAARLGATVVLDCQAVSVVDGQIDVIKPICGGVIHAEYSLAGSVRVITITPGAYEASTPGAPCPITPIDLPPSVPKVSVIEEIRDEAGSGPPLKQARVIVAGGLGVGSREHWNLITDTANALGAAVGATRAVVESGWAPSHQQVGYSGAKVAPELYFAIGISGAVHHLVGISQAKTVIAINSDPNADIFRVARFGAVGDAKRIMPAFIDRVRALRRGAD